MSVVNGATGATTGAGGFVDTLLLPPDSVVTYTVPATFVTTGDFPTTAYTKLNSAAAVAHVGPVVTVDVMRDWAGRPVCGLGSGAYQHIP
ncbi:hypothetical protein DD864_14200, partial [Staphylococcus pseudintermedius]